MSDLTRLEAEVAAAREYWTAGLNDAERARLDTWLDNIRELAVRGALARITEASIRDEATEKARIEYDARFATKPDDWKLRNGLRRRTYLNGVHRGAALALERALAAARELITKENAR